MLEELKEVVARAKETGNLGPHSASILAKYGDVLIKLAEGDKLLRDIAAAAGVVSKQCRVVASAPDEWYIANEALDRLDALLAKYKPEASDEND